MTLGVLIVYIAIAAILITGIVGFVFKKVDNWLVSLLQNFAGALFIFSGWVKAVDPLGTAYKMEQYFAEFEATFEVTALNFIAPLFPWLMNYVNSFSVFMIVLEIVLGVMLLLGSQRKLTAWLFFLIVGFFTFLTGFTYLTGYVPQEKVVVLEKDGASTKSLISETADLLTDGYVGKDTLEGNFFKFGTWMPYQETNMRVTDCGCFGDFIKLKPKTSFFKDILLLIPALIFLLGWKKMHQLFSKSTRNAVVLLTLGGILVYCFSNYVWDIPHADFRPFRKGVNVYEQKQAEYEAEINKEVIYVVKELATGNVLELSYDQYMGNAYKYLNTDNYEQIDQIEGEPAIPHTKISEFDAIDFEGNEMGDELLQKTGYVFMIVAYDLHDEVSRKNITIQDTSYVRDTIEAGDSIRVELKIDDIKEKVVTQDVYNWDLDYNKRWSEVVNPVLDEAMKAGVDVYALTAFASEEMIEDFKHNTQSAYPFYLADDILLKTIVRSNPGVVLMKDGTIIKKWHFTKFPDFATLQAAYLQ